MESGKITYSLFFKKSLAVIVAIAVSVSFYVPEGFCAGQNPTTTIRTIPVQSSASFSSVSAKSKKNNTSSNVITKKAADGSTLKITRDANGNITQVIRIRTNGSISVVKFNNNGAKIQAVNKNDSGEVSKTIFNAAGNKTQTTRKNNDGDVIKTTFNPAGTKEQTVRREADGSSTVVKFAADGDKISVTRKETDGDVIKTTFNPAGTKEQTVRREADGSSTVVKFAADGDKISATKREADGDVIKTTFNPAGTKEQTVRREADGSSTVVKFAADGDKTQVINRDSQGNVSNTSFNTAGNKTQTIRRTADGAVVIVNSGANNEAQDTTAPQAKVNTKTAQQPTAKAAKTGSNPANAQNSKTANNDTVSIGGQTPNFEKRSFTNKDTKQNAANNNTSSNTKKEDSDIKLRNSDLKINLSASNDNKNSNKESSVLKGIQVFVKNTYLVNSLCKIFNYAVDMARALSNLQDSIFNMVQNKLNTISGALKNKGAQIIASIKSRIVAAVNQISKIKSSLARLSKLTNEFTKNVFQHIKASLFKKNAPRQTANNKKAQNQGIAAKLIPILKSLILEQTPYLNGLNGLDTRLPPLNQQPDTSSPFVAPVKICAPEINNGQTILTVSTVSLSNSINNLPVSNGLGIIDILDVSMVNYAKTGLSPPSLNILSSFSFSSTLQRASSNHVSNSVSTSSSYNSSDYQLNLITGPQNTYFGHPERSEGSHKQRDSSTYGLIMTQKMELSNSPDIIPQYNRIIDTVSNNVIINNSINESVAKYQFAVILSEAKNLSLERSFVAPLLRMTKRTISQQSLNNTFCFSGLNNSILIRGGFHG
jgi:hypothetical protein